MRHCRLSPAAPRISHPSRRIPVLRWLVTGPSAPSGSARHANVEPAAYARYLLLPRLQTGRLAWREATGDARGHSSSRQASRLLPVQGPRRPPRRADVASDTSAHDWHFTFYSKPIGWLLIRKVRSPAPSSEWNQWSTTAHRGSPLTGSSSSAVSSAPVSDTTRSVWRPGETSGSKRDPVVLALDVEVLVDHDVAVDGDRDPDGRVLEALVARTG